jgi:hypothetical protein
VSGGPKIKPLADREALYSRGRQDATLRNVRASRRREATLAARVRRLELANRRIVRVLRELSRTVRLAVDVIASGGRRRRKS